MLLPFLLQLSVVSVRDIGPDYAITLRAWRQAWLEKRHHITAELGYSQAWWLKYDFYFAYCEAAFDIKYIHDYHVTWKKAGQPEPAAPLGVAQPPAATAAAVSTVVAAAEAGAGWVKQELPTDSVTQVRGTLLCAAGAGSILNVCVCACLYL